MLPIGMANQINYNIWKNKGSAALEQPRVVKALGFI